ncbi:MAG: D-2-hydroxyacid dehydrogenase [Rhodospirillales bacterium]|nr:D-2-hydroxyacid dehydrogenase [Rhodospirillales bacterium]
MKAIYFTHFGVELFAPTEDEAPGVEFVRVDEIEELAPVAKDCEMIVVSGSRYNAEAADVICNKMPDLKWIQSTAIGTDRFTTAGLPDDVLFTNAAGFKGKTVSEHGFAMMLGLFHRMPWVERNRQSRDWDRKNIRDNCVSAEGKSIVIIGYGSIGQEFARKARAFDMNVVVVSRKTPAADDPNVDTYIPLSNLNEALKGADVVAPCLPLTEDTKYMISDAELALMNPGAVAINIARGGIYEEAAIIRALESGHLGGAGIDVYEKEEDYEEGASLENEPLWARDDIIVTPHMASAGGPVLPPIRALVFENFRRMNAGEALKNLVEFD